MKRAIESTKPITKRQRTTPKRYKLRLIRIPERDDFPIRADEKYHYLKLSINKSPCTIGRTKENDLQIANFLPTCKTHHISGKHAVLVFNEDGQWVLKNLGRFGTGVNGKLLDKNESTVLHHGDEIMFGFYDFGGMIDTRTKFGEVKNMAHYRVEFLDPRGVEAQRALLEKKKEIEKALEEKEKQKEETKLAMKLEIEEKQHMLELSERKEKQSVAKLKAEHDREMTVMKSSNQAEIQNLKKTLEDQQNEKLSTLKKENDAKVKKLLRDKDISEETKRIEIEKLQKDHEKKMQELENTTTCSICLCLKVYPVSTKCGHTFCKKCIFEWKARHKQCPICRKKLVVNKAVLCELMQSIECLAEREEEYAERKEEHKEWLRKKRLN